MQIEHGGHRCLLSQKRLTGFLHEATSTTVVPLIGDALESSVEVRTLGNMAGVDNPQFRGRIATIQTAVAHAAFVALDLGRGKRGHGNTGQQSDRSKSQELAKTKIVGESGVHFSAFLELGFERLTTAGLLDLARHGGNLGWAKSAGLENNTTRCVNATCSRAKMWQKIITCRRYNRYH